MAKEKSDLSRAFSEDGALKTHVGGQALLEGVMMRGKYNWAVAVREPDGAIYTEEHDLASGKKTNGWLYWPLVRGCRAFVESLVLGYRALSIAAEHAFAEEVEGGSDEASITAAPLKDADGSELEDPARFSWKHDFGSPTSAIEALGAQTSLEVVNAPGSLPAYDALADDCETDDASIRQPSAEPVSEIQLEDSAPSKKEPVLSSTEMTLSMVLGLVLGIVLFIVAPAFVTNLIVGEYDAHTLTWNIVDGIVRIAVFVFYIWLIGRMEDIKRMFAYHGAEHKTIHCYEHGLALTPENARTFPCLHVRCGTAFLIMVMIIAIFVYTITPLNSLIAAWGVPDGLPKLALVIVVRILLLPVIAGVSYEITVRWAGSHPDNPLVKVVLWPGLQMQRLTTREPGDNELACAIAAMNMVLEREEAERAARGGKAPAPITGA